MSKGGERSRDRVFPRGTADRVTPDRGGRRGGWSGGLGIGRTVIEGVDGRRGDESSVVPPSAVLDSPVYSSRYSDTHVPSLCLTNETDSMF